MIYTHGSKIDANLLLILNALLQSSSVTEAARRVGLSQSAVSHALARLRDQLGDPLLVRAGRRMVLTPKALALAPRVRRVAGDIQRIFAADAPLEPAGLRRTFHLHIPEPVLFVLGPALEAALSSRAPLVDLYTSSSGNDVIEELRSGALDLAVDVFPEPVPDLDVHALYSERLVCVVRGEHPVVVTKPEPGHDPAPGPAQQATLSIEQFTALPHLMVTPARSPRAEAHDEIDDLLSEKGLSRRVARVVSHSLMACVLLACTDYMAVLPERLLTSRPTSMATELATSMATSLAEHLNLRILEPPLALPPYPLSLIWHQRNSTDPAHRWLRELIASVAPTDSTGGATL
jgi:DNA-binding transcriptional LysR family regulator